MNHSKLKWISLIYLLLGASGAGLHRMIYSRALDDRGLIVPGNVYGIVLLVLTAAALLGAVAVSTKTKVTANGKPPVVGCIVYALGIWSLTLTGAKGPAPLVLLYRTVTYAALVSLALMVILRLLGKPHYFLLDVCPCLLCILHLVECYQLWSEVPQLMDYVFSLGAILCAMLFSYHNMAMRAELPGSRVYVFAGLAGIFFCCIAAMQNVFPYYFLSTAVWMIGMFFVPRAVEA